MNVSPFVGGDYINLESFGSCKLGLNGVLEFCDLFDSLSINCNPPLLLFFNSNDF